MGYTLFEKIKVGGYALGSAIAAGSSAFAFSSLVSAGSLPFVVTATVLGTTYSLLNTVHTKLQEVKKNRAKIEKIEKQQNDQQKLRKKLRALKHRIKDRLEEENERLEEDEKEKENTVTSPKKTAYKRKKLITPRAELDKKEDRANQQAEKDRQEAKGMQEAKERRQKIREQRLRGRRSRERQSRIFNLQAALGKLAELEGIFEPPQTEKPEENSVKIILPVIQSSTSLQSEAVAEKRLKIRASQYSSVISIQRGLAPENTVEKNANTLSLEKIVYIGKRGVSGCIKGATAAYGAIHTGAILVSKIPPPFLSAPIVVSVGLLGALGAVGNAYLGEKEWASELQNEESDALYERTRQQLEIEYDSIMQLLDDQQAQVAKRPIKTGLEQEKNSAPSLQLVAADLLASSVNSTTPREVSAPGEVVVDILPASPPSRNAFSVLTKTSGNLKSSVAGNPYLVFTGRPTSPPSRASSPNKKSDFKSRDSLGIHQSKELSTQGTDRLFTPTRTLVPDVRLEQIFTINA